MKTFKEKKQFYKERQEIYDNVSYCKKNNISTFVLEDRIFDIVDREIANYVLVYIKTKKRPMLLEYYDDHQVASNKDITIHLCNSRKSQTFVLLYLREKDYE